MKKFNHHQNIAIDKVRADVKLRKGTKEKPSHRQREYSSHETDQRSEELFFKKVKHLQGGKKKYNTDKDKIFDLKNDGKPIKVKKESKYEKLSRPFVMLNEKKYHEINGKYMAAAL